MHCLTTPRLQFKVENCDKVRKQSGGSLPYYSMNLELHGDYINKIQLEKGEILIIMLESGTLILFSLPKNEPISIIQSDRWMSSVFVKDIEVWSIGKNRRLIVQDMIFGRKRFCLQLIRDIEGYYENGIDLQKMKREKYFTMNIGYGMIQIVDSKTRKILKRMDLLEILGLPYENNRPKPALKEFRTSKLSSEFIFLINVKNSFLLIVVDLRLVKEVSRTYVFPLIDESVYRLIGYHLLVSHDELVVVTIFQLTRKERSDLITYITVLDRSSIAEHFKLVMTRKLEEIKELVICKEFTDEHLKLKDKKLFVVGSEIGVSQSYVYDTLVKRLRPVERIFKSDYMLTSQIMNKHISYCSTLNGNIIAIDTTPITSQHFGPISSPS